MFVVIYQYRFHAPGSDLQDEPFDIQDQTRARADARADFHVRDTFSLARRTDVRAVFVAEYTSRRAAERAESGETCKRHDFRDGDICSRCDAMRRSA